MNGFSNCSDWGKPTIQWFVEVAYDASFYRGQDSR